MEIIHVKMLGLATLDRLRHDGCACSLRLQRSAPLRSRQADHGRVPALHGRAEADLYRQADAHRLGLAIDDVGHEDGAFYQLDVSQNIGHGASPNNSIRMDDARARYGHPGECIGPAERAVRPWVPVEFTTGVAAGQHEFAAGCGFPERAGLGERIDIRVL
jgi:hypothetical protein